MKHPLLNDKFWLYQYVEMYDVSCTMYAAYIKHRTSYTVHY